jgi:hypothetical protein
MQICLCTILVCFGVILITFATRRQIRIWMTRSFLTDSSNSLCFPFSFSCIPKHLLLPHTLDLKCRTLLQTYTILMLAQSEWEDVFQLKSHTDLLIVHPSFSPGKRRIALSLHSENSCSTCKHTLQKALVVTSNQSKLKIRK